MKSHVEKVSSNKSTLTPLGRTRAKSPNPSSPSNVIWGQSYKSKSTPPTKPTPHTSATKPQGSKSPEFSQQHYQHSPGSSNDYRNYLGPGATSKYSPFDSLNHPPDNLQQSSFSDKMPHAKPTSSSSPVLDPMQELLTQLKSMNQKFDYWMYEHPNMCFYNGK